MTMLGVLGRCRRTLHPDCMRLRGTREAGAKATTEAHMQGMWFDGEITFVHCLH
jgi:hypothetical protein